VIYSRVETVKVNAVKCHVETVIKTNPTTYGSINQGQ